MLNLPKKYLSYSAIDLFLRSPEQFRKRYYENQPMFETPELAFGKKIATLLENADGSLSHIKQYQKPEQQIKVTIEGVPIFGFIDSFDPDTKTFIEFKTGRTPWTQKRVNTHLQLDIYSLCIEELFGEVNDECELIWLQTTKRELPQTGLIAHRDVYEIHLTGIVKTFSRVITKEDRESTRELIVKTAQAISDDYTEWQKPKVGLLP